MKAVAFALFVIGYAALYAGASNLMTGGQGWGFMQALLNKGTGNQSLSGLGTIFSSGSSSGSTAGIPNPLTPLIPGLGAQGLGLSATTNSPASTSTPVSGPQ